MNVDKWREALSVNNLLPQYSDVIDGFTHGFDQGIPQHAIDGKPWFTPENHKSSLLVRDKIEESIAKEIAAKRMMGPFSHQLMKATFGFFRSNPLGAVVNGDGQIRPINDLSFPRNDPEIKSVNSYVNKLDFETTWDDFKTVSKFLAEDKRQFELALFDWEKAYQQIPTRQDQWKYLLVQDFNGNLLINTRITFGGVAGCGSFGRPADAWKLIMKNHFDLVNIFRWVDDNLFIKEVEGFLSMKDVVVKSTELGVMTNIKKFSEFAEEQKFIGFVWNGKNKTVRLPEGKIEQRLNQIHPFQVEKAMFDYEEAEILVGRLNHVSYILPHLRCNLCSLYQWLKSWIWRKAKRPTPTNVLEDLRVWVDTLNNFEHMRLINWGPPLDKGKSLIVWTDNTTTENSINNMKTKDKEANDEWKRIQEILLRESVNLIARRVKSKDNKADALSRGLRSVDYCAPNKMQPSANESFFLSIRDFTSQGHLMKFPSKLDQHVLNGWSRSTLKSYNSGVRKFLLFKKTVGQERFLLPATEDDIYNFCFWAGKKDIDNGQSGVLSVTLKKYLQGLKAWHIFHNRPYPTISEKKVSLLLKSSQKIETLLAKKEPKKPVMIKHLISLVEDLATYEGEDAAILDLALVAFWSLARLGELTIDPSNPRRKIIREYVTIHPNGSSATIELKESKTAPPGESQFLQLKGMANSLCPVRALIRQMSACNRHDHLFGFRKDNKHVALTKYLVKRRLAILWDARGFTGLSGHSFRVGGASFQNALGIPPAHICKIGRWASASYKLYLRTYSEEDLSFSLKLLSRLDLQWRLA
ncbi:uncharacterized protein PGTG_22250 [Puccinia graminis f. sp. tritici CRL 75-36-700-3]|uniref:Tyr recombinase domain-containing protein n=1 Tax=Puccinia graminis f. sp. tritici (strain CRL 75-36-700-3 / race SCCL) TaxID=418459 RepID=H6QU00_PUCGT|nr:uncharacterized protein PGTG_22250 [Puccinia graminis f. sp. tritici CRL 75-36-700-3]EHS64414.1 hypothetical protein PGTG_22250 [Puccinia graminis f. sp. tritici CRL 75-36-700-3]